MIRAPSKRIIADCPECSGSGWKPDRTRFCECRARYDEAEKLYWHRVLALSILPQSYHREAEQADLAGLQTMLRAAFPEKAEARPEKEVEYISNLEAAYWHDVWPDLAELNARRAR